MAAFRKAFVRLPDPRSPAGKHFDWSAVGLSHPHSPAGRRFDWLAAGLLHPDAPAAKAFSWKNALAYRTAAMRPTTVSGAEIRIPKTPEVVCERPEISGGGFFKIHAADYECSSPVLSSGLKPRDPEIEVCFNRSKGQFEIRSITIYTLKIINNQDPRSRPRAGDNVLNLPYLDVRTPKDNVEGKGYWRKVIGEMERYEAEGVNLQWYVPGSPAYHEEVHNKQFRHGIRKNHHALIRKIETTLNFALLDTGEVTEADVRRAARDAVKTIITDVGAVTGTDSEAPAYRETFAAIWKPEIEKIRTYARVHGWK